MKKKERLQGMEQTMSDLQRKAEDLEKEVGELRRENSWLKEMVIMKGKQRGALGQDSSAQGPSKRGKDDEDSD
jgi:regulator of replication initiation timing